MAEKTLEMQQLNFPKKRLQKPYFLPNQNNVTITDDERFRQMRGFYVKMLGRLS